MAFGMEGKPSSEPPDCNVKGAFKASSSLVNGVGIIGAVCRLLFVAHEPITERYATSDGKQKEQKERVNKLSENYLVVKTNLERLDIRS